MRITNAFNWNSKWYGIRKLKKGNEYYKSDNCRFDNLCGKTVKISSDEYRENAKKYVEIVGEQIRY